MATAQMALRSEYFQEYNLDAQGRYIDECSMHALNSTLVNCLDRPPIEMVHI